MRQVMASILCGSLHYMQLPKYLKTNLILVFNVQLHYILGDQWDAYL
jgi:hypothetical protein